MTNATAARFRKSGKRYLLDNEPVISVTTVIGDGYPKPALVTWANTATAQYAVDHWDDLSALSITARYRELDGVHWSIRDAAAVDGTRVHEYGERVAHGEAVEVPDEYRAQVERYARWLDAWRWEVLLTERPVVNLSHGWAGTFDLLAIAPDGVLWLLDVKTGKGVYDDHAVQLSAYAHAEYWLDSDGELQPWPAPDRCGVIHVRPDHCELRPVDGGDDTYQVFMHVKQVAEFRRRASQAFKDREPWPVAPALDPPA